MPARVELHLNVEQFRLVENTPSEYRLGRAARLLSGHSCPSSGRSRMSIFGPLRPSLPLLDHRTVRETGRSSIFVVTSDQYPSPQGLFRTYISDTELHSPHAVAPEMSVRA
jgi:hypothetical protein